MFVVESTMTQLVGSEYSREIDSAESSLGEKMPLELLFQLAEQSVDGIPSAGDTRQDTLMHHLFRQIFETLFASFSEVFI